MEKRYRNHSEARACAVVKRIARRLRRARMKDALRRGDDPSPVRVSWWVEDGKYVDFRVAGGR